MDPVLGKQKDGSDWARDLNHQYMEPADEDYLSCRDGIAVNGNMMHAYTIKFSSWKPQVTRLCPLFLSLIAAQRFWSSEQINPS